MILNIILTVLGLMLIGFIKRYRDFYKVTNDMNFLADYNKSYITYLNNYFRHDFYAPQVDMGEEEAVLHDKLLSQADKAQRLLGESGVVDYSPPFAQYIIKNYQILINVVPNLRNPSGFTTEFEWINNILIMQIGRYQELQESIKKEFRNPIILLREGVQFFTTLPISLLYWTGLIQYSTLYKLSNNIIVKFINFIIILFGFISAIFTIVLGWDEFKEFLSMFF